MLWAEEGAAIIDFGKLAGKIVLDTLSDRLEPPEEFMKFEGWVKKFGQHHMGLRRRFLVVDGAQLTYYKKPDQTTAKGTIHLSPFSSSRFIDKGDMVYSIKEVRATKPHGVMLSILEEKRSYCFFCDSEEERHSLLQVFRNNVEMIRRSVKGTVLMLSAVLNLGHVNNIGRLKMALRFRYHVHKDDSWKEKCTLAKLLRALSNPVDPLSALRLLYFRYRKAIESEALAAGCTSAMSPTGSILDIQEPGTGWTILMRSIDHENDDIAIWIIRHGASVDLRDIDDDTALIIASRLGRRRVVRALLEHGADRTLRNRWDECAATEAVGIPEIEDMLRSFFPVRLAPMTESEIAAEESELRSACFGSVTGETLLARGSTIDLDAIGLLPPGSRGSRRDMDGFEDVLDSEGGSTRMVSTIDHYDDDDDDDDGGNGGGSDDDHSDGMNEEDDDLEHFERSSHIEKNERPHPPDYIPPQESEGEHAIWESDDSDFEDTLEPQIESGGGHHLSHTNPKEDPEFE